MTPVVLVKYNEINYMETMQIFQSRSPGIEPHSIPCFRINKIYLFNDLLSTLVHLLILLMRYCTKFNNFNDFKNKKKHCDLES